MNKNKLASIYYNSNDTIEKIIKDVGSFSSDEVEFIQMLDKDKYSKEKKLLIKLCRVSLNDKDIKVIGQILNESLNWSYIIFSCIHHKITQLFWSNMLKCPEVNLINGQIKRFYNFMYESNLIRNNCIFDELEQIVKEFNNNNIKYMILKGSFLINNVYNKFERTVNDIDVLVDVENVNDAVTILKTLNYEFGLKYDWFNNEKSGINKKQELLWKMYSHNLPLLLKKSDNPFVKIHEVDLSTKIFKQDDEYSFETKDMFDINRFCLINSVSARMLSYEYLIIHLCIHLYREATSETSKNMKQHHNLIKYCDLFETLRKYKSEIDFDLFLEIILKNNIEIPVCYSLYYTQIIYDCPEIMNIIKTIEKFTGREIINSFKDDEKYECFFDYVFACAFDDRSKASKFQSYLEV